MTLKEMIDDICAEFPYFKEFKKWNDWSLSHSFTNALKRNKDIYQYNKMTKEWSLLPCKEKISRSPNNQFFGESSKTSINQQSEAGGFVINEAFSEEENSSIHIDLDEDSSSGR